MTVRQSVNSSERNLNLARAPKISKRPRTKPAEERLDDLLNAAMDVFSAKGISSATIDEIVAEAGVAKGTFYLYFDSKDHAVGQLWNRYTAGMIAACSQALEGDGGAPDVDRVVDVFGEMARYVLKNAKLHRLVHRTAAADALELVRQGNSKVIDMVSDRISQWSKAGHIRCEHPALTVSILFHGACRALHDSMMDQDEANDEELIAAVRSLARTSFEEAPKD